MDTLGDGSRWDYSYDWLGQLTRAVKVNADGATAHLNKDFNFTDDWMGNPMTERSAAVGNFETLNYAANKQNQLTSVPHSAHTAFMGQVNPAANISVLSSVWFEPTKVRQGEDYRVALNTGIENSDRYLAFTNYAVLNSAANAPDVVATGVVNLFIPKGASEVPVYDADGNLTSDGRWTYAWDALNRLKSIESKADAPAASKHRLVFTYDAGGRRIQKEEFTWNLTPGTWNLGTSTKFLYDGWNMVAELDTSHSALRTYGWLGKGGGLLWMKDHASGEFHVPGYDGNGNITRLIKYSDKTVSAEYEYGPYGGLLRATGPMAQANPFRFSSEYQDDVTGLVYYGHRYFSPNTRRWLSKDPIGLAGGLNLYGFVGNDPINNWDLLGLVDENGNGSWEYKCEDFRIDYEGYYAGKWAALTAKKATYDVVAGAGAGLGGMITDLENFGQSGQRTAPDPQKAVEFRQADDAGKLLMLYEAMGENVSKHNLGFETPSYYWDKVSGFFKRPFMDWSTDVAATLVWITGPKVLRDLKEPKPPGPITEPVVVPQKPNIPKPAAPPEVKCPTIHDGKQGKHLPDHNNFQKGKSEVTHPNPQSLVDRFSGKGQKSPTGQREWVDTGEIVGDYIDRNGNRFPTTRMTIHYADDGTVHIVPAPPDAPN